MAVRTTAAEVKEIMDNCTLDDTVVDAYIVGANAWIDNILADDITLGDTLLETLEQWFTAHMIAVSTCRTASKEKLGEAAVEYTGKWGMKLNSTSYGQMVLTLDTTGLLAKAGKESASIYAITSFD